MESPVSFLFLVLSIAVAVYYHTFTSAAGSTGVNYVRNNYKTLPAIGIHRTVIVHLDNWSYDDIAKECEFLNEQGYAAVQISPVTAHAKSTNFADPGTGEQTQHSPIKGTERLSVASYEIKNDSGDEQKLKSMIETCKKNKVRVLIDVVLNNMMRMGDTGPYATLVNSNKEKNYGLPNEPPIFFEKYFHDDLKLDEEIYKTDKEKVWVGQLDGLNDLKQVVDGVPNVHMIGFLYKLINLGAAGFRILNADHMNPEELVKIYDALPDLPGEPIPTRPFIYSDVYDPYHENGYAIKDEEYVKYTRVTDYKYAAELTKAIRFKHNPFEHFKTFDTPKEAKEGSVASTEWNLRANGDSVVFLSTSMTHIFKIRTLTLFPQMDQNNMKYIETINDEDDMTMKITKAGLGFMLTHGHGIPLITSIYWKSGPATKPVKGAGPVHRWETTKRTMQWRNYILTESNGVFPKITNWQAVPQKHQVAYCVGKIGFVVINNENPAEAFNKKVNVCFEKNGVYCDVFGGGIKNKSGKTPQEICEGSSIQVANGEANVNTPLNDCMQLYNTEDYVEVK